MKKVTALCLVVLMAFSLCACTAVGGETASQKPDAPQTTETPVATPDPTPAAVSTGDDELDRAISLGIVPIEMQKDFDATITFKQFCILTDNMIAVYNKDLCVEWEETAKLAFESDDEMLRQHGMLALLYAAKTMGLADYNGLFQYKETHMPDEPWDSMLWDYPMFPDWQERLDIGWDADLDHVAASVMLSMRRVSRWTNKTVFDWDDTGSLRVGDKLTCRDAILAVVRLYDSQIDDSEVQRLQQRVPTEFDEAILNAADERRAAILSSKTEVSFEGTAYYVSNSGNDENDGLTPQTAWATLDKVQSARLKPGDAVFFERGGLWRGTIYAQKGVTYSAYGEGEKPRIYGSPENGADPAKWSLLDGTDNIWVYYRDMTDCGTLAFNEGENFAYKETPSFVDGRFVLRDDHATPFDVKTQLDNDLEFFSEADSYLTNGVPYTYGVMDARDVVGTLYLRCDEGNPGKVFSSIEFLTAGNTIVPADETVYDNLCIRYCGSHALFAGGMHITVQNCEFGFIGGCIQFYDENGDVMCYGNAIESDGTYTGYRVLNNYIYQVYDAGASNQATDFDGSYSGIMENIEYSGNLIEYCHYGIEIFFNTGEPDTERYLMKNVLISDNYIMYSCYGWGTQGRGDGAAIAMHDYPNAAENFVIRDNVLYLSAANLVTCGAEPQWLPQMHANTYVQSKYGLLGNWRAQDGTYRDRLSFTDDDLLKNIETILRDDAPVLPPDIISGGN